ADYAAGSAGDRRGANLALHAGADPQELLAADLATGWRRTGRRSERSRVPRQARSVRAERAEDRIPDRLHAVHSVPGDRSHRIVRLDGDGHDDAVAARHLLAFQAAAVRARRRLDAHGPYAGD